MKKNKNILKMMIVALLVITTSSCSDLFSDHDTSYDGPAQLELTPLTSSVTLYDVLEEVEIDTTNEDTTYTYTSLEGTSLPGAAETLTVDVQLIGEQRDQEIPVSISVIEDETNAVEGLEDGHYSLSSTSMAIPANSSGTSFDINVVTDNLGIGETVQLVLELQSSSDIQPAENLRRYTLGLVGADTLTVTEIVE